MTAEEEDDDSSFPSETWHYIAIGCGGLVVLLFVCYFGYKLCCTGEDASTQVQQIHNNKIDATDNISNGPVSVPNVADVTDAERGGIEVSNLNINTSGLKGGSDIDLYSYNNDTNSRDRSYPDY